MRASSVASYRSSSVAPMRASSVAPYKSSTATSIRASSVVPMRASSVAPLRASSVAPIRASSVAPYRSSSVAPYRSAAYTTLRASSTDPYLYRHQRSSSVPPKTVSFRSTPLISRIDTTIPTRQFGTRLGMQKMETSIKPAIYGKQYQMMCLHYQSEYEVSYVGWARNYRLYKILQIVYIVYNIWLSIIIVFHKLNNIIFQQQLDNYLNLF